MKTFRNLFAILLLPVLSFSQATIDCPDNVVVHPFDLDRDYETYGDPVITNQGNLVLDKNVSIVDNGCQTEYMTNATLTYSLVNPSNNNKVAECQQHVDVQHASLDDILVPNDITINDSWVNDPPTVELDVEYLLNSNIFVTYSDTEIPGGDNIIKIVRTITYLDWCTAETIEHTMVIRLVNGLQQSNIGAVTTCSGELVKVDYVVVTTDAPGVTIDQSNCLVGGDDLKTFLNCVVEANPIPNGFNYTLEIVKDSDALNGISTLDLVLIQRHILGIQTFDDPYKLIASDVSGNQSITALDLIEIRKLILGFYDEFPVVPSWTFVIEEVTTSPLTSKPDDELTFSKVNFPLQSLTIRGIKTGDVNCSHK